MGLQCQSCSLSRFSSLSPLRWCPPRRPVPSAHSSRLSSSRCKAGAAPRRRLPLRPRRRLQADRFYTDSYNEDVYTPEGLRWIDRTDLKTVILRHYPELADSGLANIKNAFEPWDEGPELNPTRHPLREWDAELRDDPWRRDGYRQGLGERKC